MKDHTDELYDGILRACTVKMLASRGFRYADYLMHYENLWFWCTQLRLNVEHPPEEQNENNLADLLDSDVVDFRTGCPDLPLPMTDCRTLTAIGKRFHTLRNLEREYRLNNDLACLQDVRDEIDKLNCYLEEVTHGKGIKSFCHDLLIKDYHAVEADLRHFLINIRKHDEHLYWQLKAHLVIKLQCAWVSD